MEDVVMARVTAAVQRGRAGERAAARQELEDLWSEVEQGGGDDYTRCVIAHFLADLQDDVREELGWDERALAAADGVADERAQGFLPSLYGSLADDHRRLGDPDRAREYLDRAQGASGVLGDDPYSDLVRGILDAIGRALADGSTEPLPAG